MSLPYGVIVEGVVALLLMLTIGYCVVLNDKLKRLHADRDALKQMVSDLVQATNLANTAISGLRGAASEAEETLRARLDEADRFAVELANHVNAGKAVVDRIARITEAVERSPQLAAPKPARTVGSAEALEQLAAMQKRREKAA